MYLRKLFGFKQLNSNEIEVLEHIFQHEIHNIKLQKEVLVRMNDAMHTLQLTLNEYKYHLSKGKHPPQGLSEMLAGLEKHLGLEDQKVEHEVQASARDVNAAKSTISRIKEIVEHM
jgi:hypothetical protein